jgi:hypothetical protein
MKMPSEIVIPHDGTIGRVIVEREAIIVAFEIRVRFNRRIEVLDPSGALKTAIDIANRRGALAPLWNLTEVADVARIEMDEQSFRIVLTDGAIIRSRNVLDVRRPELAQVEFWTPVPGHYDDPPVPEQVKCYPAMLAAQ